MSLSVRLDRAHALYCPGQAAARKTGRRGNSSHAASEGERQGTRCGIREGNLLSMSETTGGHRGGIRGRGSLPAAASSRDSRRRDSSHSSRNLTSENPICRRPERMSSGGRKPGKPTTKPRGAMRSAPCGTFRSAPAFGSASAAMLKTPSGHSSMHAVQPTHK